MIIIKTRGKKNMFLEAFVHSFVCVVYMCICVRLCVCIDCECFLGSLCPNPSSAHLLSVCYIICVALFPSSCHFRRLSLPHSFFSLLHHFILFYFYLMVHFYLYSNKSTFSQLFALFHFRSHSFLFIQCCAILYFVIH